jgi:hypothetical protein
MLHLTRLTIIPNLLVDHGRVDRSMRDGETIASAMREAGWIPGETHARVSIDGRLIPSAQWEYIVPARGSSIVLRRVPMGGGGGGGKQTGSLVAMIAVMALAIAAPYAVPGLLAAGMGSMGFMTSFAALGAGTFGGMALSAGIGIGGMLAVRALIPAPLPRRLTEIAHDEKLIPISTRAERHHARRSAQRAVIDGRRTGESYRSRLADRTLVADLR